MRWLALWLLEFRSKTGNADTHAARGTRTGAAGTGDKRQSTNEGERSEHTHGVKSKSATS
eukprot:6735765-Prymnesium_polylepis.1